MRNFPLTFFISLEYSYLMRLNLIFHYYIFHHFRYTDPNEDNDAVNRETLHLQRLKQKIEERKKKHKLNDSNPDTITLVQPAPSKDEIIKDGGNQDPARDQNEKSKVADNGPTFSNNTTSKTKAEKPTSEFKVLGSTDFEKKSKVIYL